MTVPVWPKQHVSHAMLSTPATHAIPGGDCINPCVPLQPPTCLISQEG
jgi:hypothetical protein